MPTKTFTEISEKLVYLRQFISKEFCCKPRSLFKIDLSKAAELSQQLLNTGPLTLTSFQSHMLTKLRDLAGILFF